MLPPYPIEIVPLIQQFLQRRQGRFDFPVRATERLGIDRPALAFVSTIGAGPVEGSLPTQIGSAAYYTILDAWRPQAAVTQQGPDDVDAAIGRLRERGWLDEGEPLRATESGRTARQGIEDETDRLLLLTLAG